MTLFYSICFPYFVLYQADKKSFRDSATNIQMKIQELIFSVTCLVENGQTGTIFAQGLSHNAVFTFFLLFSGFLQHNHMLGFKKKFQWVCKKGGRGSSVGRARNSW